MVAACRVGRSPIMFRVIPDFDNFLTHFQIFRRANPTMYAYFFRRTYGV